MVLLQEQRLEFAVSMHDVEALIAKSDKLVAGARQFESAITCPLVQGFSLLPITDAFAKELALYQSEAKAAPDTILKISDGLRILAIEISQGSPVAYIRTYYFGGQGGQDALVWDKGTLQFSPNSPRYNQDWPNSPISQALRMIGVVAGTGEDEFDTLGLGKYRETHKWAASVTSAQGPFGARN